LNILELKSQLNYFLVGIIKISLDEMCWIQMRLSIRLLNIYDRLSSIFTSNL